MCRLSRNVDHVNNIPALCPLCSRLRCYRGCISSLQPRCYVEGGFSAAPLSVFHSITHNDESCACTRLYTALSPWSVKRLICCAMAVTHLTITAAKKPQIGTMSVSMNNGRREGGGRGWIDMSCGNTTRRIFHRYFAYTFSFKQYCTAIDLFLRFLYAFVLTKI